MTQRKNPEDRRRPGRKPNGAEPASVQIGIRATPALASRLQSAAAARGVTVSAALVAGAELWIAAPSPSTDVSAV